MEKPNESKLSGFFQKLSDELHERPMLGSNPAVQRLIARMRKRAAYIRPELEDKCFKQFIELNESLKSSKVRISPQVLADARYFITSAFERFNTRENELNIQVTLDMSVLFDRWRFGPGASNGVVGTHTVDKINQKMTCTASCEHLVVMLRSISPYFQAFDAMNNGGTSVHKGSKLTTVPKNEDTVRIIAIEPSGNMALQLAAGQYITDVLKSIGLDIESQQMLNKQLAKRGSIDGSLATIDLKSASDMFTPELIQLLFPPDWYELLMKIRSPSTSIKGKDYQLNMISTMGNGYTFPLMTFCLVALIYAFRAQRGGPTLWVDWTNTAVFGDDIIIPADEYGPFTTLLSEAGLVVNHDKSYCDGPFRESCGGDYYDGVDITPFYVTSLAYDSEVYVAINKVMLWGARQNIFLPKTLLYLKQLLRRPFLVPEWSNPDQGIQTTLVAQRYKYLQPIKETKRLHNSNLFYAPLAIGGYIFSDSSKLEAKDSTNEQGAYACYIPRQYNTRYCVRRGRLPKGYLSGRTAEYFRRISDSTTIDLWVSILFADAHGFSALAD